ncbi:MAG: zinc-binding dehydrogenase, partial [Rubripirellula sp.]
RMIIMAGRDARPVFPVGPFYVKECTVSGFVMFKATPEEMKECAEQINDWMAKEQLKANIGATFPIDEIAAAHALQESATLHQQSDLSGKIVIQID